MQLKVSRIKPVKKKAEGFWTDFRLFITKGNVINLAVGVVLGGAFQGIINAAVNGVILPFAGMFTNGVDFSQQFLDLTQLMSGTHSDLPLLTAEAAQAEGHVVLSYGTLITAIINFLIISLVIFLVIRSIGSAGKRLQKREAKLPPAPPEAPSAKDCPYCCSQIPIKAVRCPCCTSILEENAERRIQEGEAI